jgi:hypothetical protein
MNTLFDCISLDNKPYNELSQSKKKKLELFIDQIKEEGLENKILSFTDRNYDATEHSEGFEHNSTFPKDLSDEIDKVWVSLKH